MITATPMSVIASETEHPDQISESSIAPSAAENSESGLRDANFVEADLMVQIHGEAIDSTLSTDLDWDCYTTIDKMISDTNTLRPSQFDDYGREYLVVTTLSEATRSRCADRL